MLDLNILDETFDINQSHNYHLSILTDNNDLSMCILDTIRNKYIGIHHHYFTESDNQDPVTKIKSVLEIDDLLKLQYKSVSNMIMNEKNTLVPLAYFDDNKKDNILQLNFPLSPNATTLVNKLTIPGVFNIFSYSDDLRKILSTAFPTIKTFHHSTPFIEHLIYESAKWTQPKCHVLIHNNSLDIGLAQLKKLEFFNSFYYHEYSDILYFILSVLERYKLPALSTDVFISVEKDNRNEIVEYLNNYLIAVRFIRPSNQFTYSYIFDEKHLVRYANLFNLALCE